MSIDGYTQRRFGAGDGPIHATVQAARPFNPVAIRWSVGGGIGRRTNPSRWQNRRRHQRRTSPIMIELLGFVSGLITLYIYVIFASVIISWLMSFGIVNPHNPTARAIYQALQAVTEPLLRPIRRVLPDMGAIDISPIILLLVCQFLQMVVIPNIAKSVA
ncbi:MAG: YggT family protein [Hyphomicrobium aestuarii]|nr:YggT family protein [Hyphomicrobium aestuarii]